jgi:hypothetical protein
MLTPARLLLLAGLVLVPAAPALKERMLTPNSYNCFTRERWSDEKKAWCCENKSLGCDGNQEPLMQVLGRK